MAKMSSHDVLAVIAESTLTHIHNKPDIASVAVYMIHCKAL